MNSIRFLIVRFLDARNRNVTPLPHSRGFGDAQIGGGGIQLGSGRGPERQQARGPPRQEQRSRQLQTGAAAAATAGRAASAGARAARGAAGKSERATTTHVTPCQRSHGLRFELRTETSSNHKATPVSYTHLTLPTILLV